MRSQHIAAIRNSKSQGELSAIDSEVRIAVIVDRWAKMIDLDQFSNRLGDISFSNRIREEWFDELEACSQWLLNRPWPLGFEPIQESLTNFRQIADDLLSIVGWYHSRERGYVEIDRAYKELDGFASDDQYNFLLRRHQYTVDLSRDLAFELTRAANLVCERVRQSLWPAFRLEEGNLVFQSGLSMGLSSRIYVPLYTSVDSPSLYPGLQEFAAARKDGEDFGSGLPSQGFAFPGLRAANAE